MLLELTSVPVPSLLTDWLCRCTVLSQVAAVLRWVSPSVGDCGSKVVLQAEKSSEPNTNAIETDD